MDFLRALTNPDIVFLRYALIAGVFASVAFGFVGTYVVVKRISSAAGAISHSVLAGIGLALYLRATLNLEWLEPTAGAFVAAFISALVVWWVKQYAAEREDTIIGAVWAVGMALGLLFIAKTPGYADPMVYLFGNILIITKTDIVLIAFWDVIILIFGLLYYRQIQALAFDEEFAGLRGINVPLNSFILLLLVAFTVVLLATIVGIVMVIALLTLPTAIASRYSRRLWHIMLLASLLTLCFTAGGLWLSYQTNLPSGPVIIVIAGVTYLLNLIAARLKIRLSS